MGYPVYLWTEMAFLRDQENQGYFLVTWKLEGLVSKERMKTRVCGHIRDQITNHLLLYLLLKV